MTEAARGVGEDASHIYLIRERGFKPAVAFKEAQDMGHSGYAGQLQQALVKGVVEPIGEWLRDVSRSSKRVWYTLLQQQVRVAVANRVAAGVES